MEGQKRYALLAPKSPSAGQQIASVPSPPAEVVPPESATPATDRVSTNGKHLALGGVSFRVRGVTYGGFLPRPDGEPFPEADLIRADLRAMSTAGVNVVRTYVLPPQDLIDAATEVGIRVLVGLNYDDWRVVGAPSRRTRRAVLEAGRRAVSAAMERCAERASVLAIAVGNEVPADLVRLHGVRSVEDTLSALVEEVHRADPKMLTTYCNYPTTEYLDVEGQDLICFNVFLEAEAPFRGYLNHLQVVSGDLPLMITELGLASELHGEQAQADSLEWQFRAVDESGCAGATIFSWTDEWAVGGVPVDGWGFGITDEKRAQKLALDVASRWARSNVRDLRARWPRISAIVCAYNEERTLEECLRSLERCDYPDLEVIVCDDGSADTTAEIAERFPFRILKLPHGGLSVARNAGLAAASGEIVAYLDADAACHEHWPYFLALALEKPSVGAAGGPNLPVPSAGLVERAVAHSPGGPIHVLLSDDLAEHVPGCNIAFRKDVLEEVGGFDPIFTAAGDDVDVCWKVVDAGHQIAYAPAAQVLHHRRARIRDYLRQQRTYGGAERTVSGRHRHRYGWLGQARWTGSIYGGPRLLPWLLRPVVYHGSLGMAPFQGVVRRRSESVLAWAGALFPAMIPFLLLSALVPLDRWWLVPGAVAVAFAVVYAIAIAFAVRPPPGEPNPMAMRSLVGLLHLLQPLARTWGRLRTRPAEPLPSNTYRARSARPGDRGEWVLALRRDVAARGCTVRVGPPQARWDLEVVAGPLVSCRITTALAWGSIPLWRMSYRPRTGVVAGAVVVSGLAIVGSVWALPVASLIGAGAMVEAGILRGRLRRSVLRTTEAQA